MEFNLSTPTAQLAFGVAQRAQEVQDMKARLEAEARARVEAQLAPYGNDLSQFDSTFKSIYDPTAAAQQARSKSMQEYVTGLPELLARVQAEKSAGGGGGGGSTTSYKPYVFDPKVVLDFLIGGTKPTTSPYGNPTTPALNAMRNRGARPVSATVQRTGSADRWG